MIFTKKKKDTEQTGITLAVPQMYSNERFAENYCSYGLYEKLRSEVPIINAAIERLVRLCGSFTVETGNGAYDRRVTELLKTVPVGGSCIGIDSFVMQYLDRLLTYGTAVAEMVPDRNMEKFGLYIANPHNIILKRSLKEPMKTDIYVRDRFSERKVKNPGLCLLSAINPKPDSLYGVSLLEGLPFVSTALVTIFDTINKNWERAGNIRYSVNYKPQSDTLERGLARDRAEQIATEWQSAMSNRNEVKDFISVGDVSIKVIGSDSKILDSEVPVRQLLEQIVAKTGLPPFLLGLSWSSTERMAEMQTDLLTSEIWAYRNLITPVITKICQMGLRMNGINTAVNIIWDDISLLEKAGEKV